MIIVSPSRPQSVVIAVLSKVSDLYEGEVFVPSWMFRNCFVPLGLLREREPEIVK